jgi:DNA mismatch repair protein MutS
VAKSVGKSGKTPLMEQYEEIKAQHPGTILLFRVGDFYETFGTDAIKAAEILGIVLTKRGNGSATEVALAGFPHHSLEVYLPKLIRAGQRVAVCEQLEDPKETKTIVKRGVTELVTPGTSLSDNLLNHKRNNFLAAVFFENDHVGLALVDVSTGEFMVASGKANQIEQMIQSYQPAEIIFPKSKSDALASIHADRFYHHPLDDWAFRSDFTYERLTRHFQTQSLKGFGIEDDIPAIVAAGIILYYLEETRHPNVAHIHTLSKIHQFDYLALDRFSVRNLELLDGAQSDGRSFVEIMDATKTPMGARLLRKWTLFPLKKVEDIEERQSIVSILMKRKKEAQKISDLLKELGDLERLVGKSATGRINPRELVQLSKSLALIQPIQELMVQIDDPALLQLSSSLSLELALLQRLQSQLQPDAPAQLVKGNIIASGVSKDLDELRNLANTGKDYLVQLQQKEVQRTGISSLKISFNNVFGYYLEVTHTHKDKVPVDWIRKQTLVNAERYVTPELKEYEEKILGAQSKIETIEFQLFQELVQYTNSFIAPLQNNAKVLASLDVLLGFAQIAQERKYSCPIVDESYALEIKNGRHPVIERFLPSGKDYIPNDVFLDHETQQIMIITGPNMAGKSALLRQTALIVMMAQMGSFVPATSAKIGIVDKIFTRVGANDNQAFGESTFMVEMNETAAILNNISARSLILLDEIGRGTSTYDGISIAWAIAEFLHQQPISKAKTLFATHYHELNEMEGQFERIKNFNVSVKEVGNQIVFVRKLQKGGSEHSFGIHVAKLAGIPQTVVHRSEEILQELEAQRGQSGKKTINKKSQEWQMNLFQGGDPTMEEVRKALESIDPNAITPMDALFTLHQLKQILKN